MITPVLLYDDYRSFNTYTNKPVSSENPTIEDDIQSKFGSDFVACFASVPRALEEKNVIILCVCLCVCVCAPVLTNFRGPK